MGEFGYAKPRATKHIKHAKYAEYIRYTGQKYAKTPPSVSGRPRARHMPKDFNQDEMAFALTMHECFPLDQEELPPGMISALLDTPQTAPAPGGFEQKITYLVFRHLRLPRPSLVPPRMPLRLRMLRASRPLLGMVASLVFVMLFTAMLAAPSFAAGLRYLLAGQTGVEQVQRYPNDVHSVAMSRRDLKDAAGPTTATNPLADMPVTAYWLGQNASQVSLAGAWVLPQQSWSQGPVVDVRYSIDGNTNGSGVLDIEEFQLASQYSAILQVVQDGAADSVNIGNVPAVYLHGGWFTAGATHAWGLSNRSALLLCEGGLVIWMVGDLRDGMDQNALMALATQLQPISLRNYVAGLPRTSSTNIGAIVPVTTSDNTQVFALVPQENDSAQGSAMSSFYISMPDISESGQPIFTLPAR